MSQPNSADFIDEEESALEAEATLEPTEEASFEESVAPEPVDDGPKQKQKTNVYTVMLIISFICIVTACILLYWELTLWGRLPLVEYQRRHSQRSVASGRLAGDASSDDCLTGSATADKHL